MKAFWKNTAIPGYTTAFSVKHNGDYLEVYHLKTFSF